MSYRYTDIIAATTVVAKEKNVPIHFRDAVTNEAEFKEHIRFYDEQHDWVVPDWEHEQPFTWQDVQPHIETQANNFLLSECKNKARKLLADSDWSVTSDVQSALQNPTDWLNYRETVRNIFLNPVVNPSFPAIPDVRWNL
jgi:hypothetical protein